MNILIRKIENCLDVGNLVGIISSVRETESEFPKEKEVTFKPTKFPSLKQDISVTKQGNGNLLIEFGKEAT